ncbi:hypothetical protein BUE80_DR001723 [Diplocarpon rosae]|nr:hypothetical protein BUE80_DR001723 [Diplocarpon rosae]
MVQGIESAIIRKLAARMHVSSSNAISGLHLRKKKVWEMISADWRGETFSQTIQPFYMNVAKGAATSSATNGNVSLAESYRNMHGFVTNFKRVSALCIIGSDFQDQHGLLINPNSMLISRQLYPVFGECKTSINRDILFPANMYGKRDSRYEYDSTYDIDWTDKRDTGVTSRGANTVEKWREMHRARLVLLTNANVMANRVVEILSGLPELKSSLRQFIDSFSISDFARGYTDVGFTEGLSCLPDCNFFGEFLAYKDETSWNKLFLSTFLVDVT